MDIKNKAGSLLVTILLVLLSGCGPVSVSTALTDVPHTLPTEALKPTSVPEVGDPQTRIRDGMVVVHVPAGQFEMGSSDVPHEQPVHTVALDAFWIDQTEVTNAMFTAFLNERGNQVEEGISWLECVFRPKSATDSDANRPLIPTQTGH